MAGIWAEKGLVEADIGAVGRILFEADLAGLAGICFHREDKE